jgi:pilus assembly protein CpaB
MGQDAAGGTNQPVVQRSATLEVTPVDAQKLTLGQSLGQLSLVLRKPGEEQNIPKVETVSLNDLRYSYLSSLPPGMRPAMAGQPATPQQAQAVRMSQPRRAQPLVRRVIAPVRPSTSTVSITRGLDTKDYEVGGYAH